MRHRALHSIGLLFHTANGGDHPFLGCCFAFRTPKHFITAAHCLGKLTPSEVGILLPLMPQRDFAQVDTIRHHPEADLAVLRIRDDPGDEVLPFREISALRILGEHVQALGYPEDAAVGKPIPSARLFSGFIQRYSQHESHLQYEYQAGEVSFGSPAGLSGGPVFPAGEVDHVLGVMAENRDSTTFLQSLTDVQDGDHRHTEEVHELIRYGIFVDFDPLRDWLIEECGGV